MRKPRAINTPLISLQIQIFRNRHIIMINAAGAVTPDAATRLTEWLADAQMWIALQEKKK